MTKIVAALRSSSTDEELQAINRMSTKQKSWVDSVFLNGRGD